jgi:hypothetical protein
MLMWTVVAATACSLAIWGAIDHWSRRLERQAPKRWPPVTVLSDDASLFVADVAPAATTDVKPPADGPKSLAPFAPL